MVNIGKREGLSVSSLQEHAVVAMVKMLKKENHPVYALVKRK